jgi:vancomycin resistance protein YoaR
MERFLIPIKQFFRSKLSKKSDQTETKTHIAITHLKNPRKTLIMIGGVLVLVGLAILISFIAETKSRFLPNTKVEGVSVGNLTTNEASVRLENAQLVPPDHTIQLVAEETTVASASGELNAHYQYEQAIDEFLVNQQKNPLRWLRGLLTDGQQQNYSLPIFYDQQRLSAMVETLKQQFDREPHSPQASLTTSGVVSSIVIDKGQQVSALKTEDTLMKLNSVLNQTTAEKISAAENQTLTVEAELTTLSKRLTDEQVTAAQQRAASLVGESLTFTREKTEKVLTDVDLIPLLKFPEGYQEEKALVITQEWAEDLNRPAQNAEFDYNPDTLEVFSFTPHQNGWEINEQQAKQAILDGLYELEGTDTKNLIDNTINKELPLAESEPEVTLANTNDLGIKERIGFGDSYYYHSIPNRVYNVSHTTNKINLTIVPPGEEFSFNQTLGDVSAATGFRSAYIIKDGQTLLGDGGGVCQVSTTLFRALLDAGLNITRRIQHSYRVSYYELDEQPGFDATVYAGNVDLRFINDTNHHLLIYGETNPNSLYMKIELYGTSDGRTTEITGYQTWDYRPPLPPEYAPDPSLAPGQTKQIDWAASGIKARFTHIIRDKDGEIIDENQYYSNYRPWAAKYLQGV